MNEFVLDEVNQALSPLPETSERKVICKELVEKVEGNEENKENQEKRKGKITLKMWRRIRKGDRRMGKRKGKANCPEVQFSF